jgi:hypothetical protein
MGVQEILSAADGVVLQAVNGTLDAWKDKPKVSLFGFLK